MQTGLSLAFIRRRRAVSREALSLDNFSYSGQSLTLATGSGIFPQGGTFKPDGTRVFVMMDHTDNEIYQYDLTTPWELSSATNRVIQEISPLEGIPTSIELSSDGGKIFYSGLDNDGIFQFGLNTPWDISDGISSEGVFLGTTAQDTNMRGVRFTPDGMRMLALGAVTDTIFEYSLTSPFDLTSATYTDRQFSVRDEVLGSQGFDISADGRSLLVSDVIDDAIQHYTLSTPWDITTASFTGETLTSQSDNDGPRCVAWGRNNTRIYEFGNGPDAIFQYNLAAPGSGPGDAPVISILTFDNSNDSGELHTDQPGAGDLHIATTMQTETLTYSVGGGWSGGVVLEAFSEAMTTDIDVATTALTGTGPRRMHIAQVNGGLVSNVLTIDYDADNTGPVLALPTSSSATDVSANWGVESDEANGIIFAAARLATDLQLGYDDIENGTGNAVSTASDTSPTADASNGGLIGGLTAGNSYVIDIFQRDAHGNPSNIVSTPAVAVVAYHYFEDFTSDVSADWTVYSAGGALTYDAANDELDFDPDGAWDRVSSPAITVVDGQDYQVEVDLRNDVSNATDYTIDLRVGTTPGGTQLGTSVDRISNETTGTITMTVTASGTTMHVTPLARSTWPSGGTMSILEVRVTEL